MRKIILGNRIYTVYRLFPKDMYRTILIVASSNAHARKIVQRSFPEELKANPNISISWNIYDGNHGITILQLGTIIHPKTRHVPALVSRAS